MRLLRELSRRTLCLRNEHGADGVPAAQVRPRAPAHPRAGLVGGPLVFASGAAQMFGIHEQISVRAAIAAVPLFAWALTLAIWLIGKGFNASAIAVASPNTATQELLSAA
jgi:hypothetical protein